MKAPVVLFTYKRKAHTQKVIESLKLCPESLDTDLIIYSDGPKTSADKKEVGELRSYLHSIDGFKKITLHESKSNKGLASSITEGVSAVVKKYGKVIVLEDDIVVSHFFLDFMNKALDKYSDETGVMSISGYMYPHKNHLPETFFFNVPLCWGWATWDRAWEFFNNNAEDHFSYIETNNQWIGFNKFGGTYLERQLRKNIKGKLNTWFINWHASVFRQNGFCLYPGRTLVHNIGFDNSGENTSNSTNFNDIFGNKPVRILDIPFVENQQAIRIVKNFYRYKANKYVRAIKRLKKRILK